VVARARVELIVVVAVNVIVGVIVAGPRRYHVTR
jgi:hypothetical protein